jgi:ribosome biogenesis GTPase
VDLCSLGWTPRFSQYFAQYVARGCVPARVAREDRGVYTLYGAFGAVEGRLTGAYHYRAEEPDDYPAVGDWVAARLAVGTAAVIEAVLPRRTKFARLAAGRLTEEQVVVANVDTVFLVTGLDQNYDVRRIERYLMVAWESGADPVVLLNKADLARDLPARLAEVEGVAPGVPVHALSAGTGQGLEALEPHLGRGQTVALLGSSGVGKSTLINRLLGEERLATGAVRADDGRGRHTTTHREMVLLPRGAVLIDNPGMRAVGLWGGEEGLSGAFEDIEALAVDCRYADCRHDREPGCAVRAALERGDLAEERMRSYRKMERELTFLAERQDGRARQRAREQGRRFKQFHREREALRSRGLAR